MCVWHRGAALGWLADAARWGIIYINDSDDDSNDDSNDDNNHIKS